VLSAFGQVVNCICGAPCGMLGVW